MVNDFVELLIDNFKQQVDSKETALGKGSAQDYAEYREMVGRLRGLREAIETVKDLAKKLESLDDD